MAVWIVRDISLFQQSRPLVVPSPAEVVTEPPIALVGVVVPQEGEAVAVLRDVPRGTVDFQEVERIGLKTGDVIIAVNGVRLRSPLQTLGGGPESVESLERGCGIGSRHPDLHSDARTIIPAIPQSFL